MKTFRPLVVLALAALAMAAHFDARAASPRTLAKAEDEVATHYAGATPEVKEYVLWTARSFGGGGLWLPEDALADMSADDREQKIQYLVKLFAEAEYGRHLCASLAEAGALKDKRLIPGLIKVAGFHDPGRDYDCRAKWMAVAALARQDAPEAVPVLVGAVDHGNQNTRLWARAALWRQTGQDFKQDKGAWAKWWRDSGHTAIGETFLRPYEPPTAAKK